MKDIEEVKLIDYSAEAEVLETKEKSSGDWFSPKSGQFRFTFLEEPRLKEVKDNFSDGMIHKLFVKVSAVGKDTLTDKEYRGEEMMYSCRKASRPDSQYGQIVLLGKAKGKLMGVETDLMVVYDGQRRKFIYSEASELVAEKIKQDQKGRADARSVANL